MQTKPRFHLKSFAKKLVAASAILLASTAAQARLANDDCVLEYIEANLMPQFPTLFGKGEDYHQSGGHWRLYLIPQQNGRTKVIGYGIHIQRNVLAVFDSWLDDVKGTKITYTEAPPSAFYEAMRANNEGCGAATNLSGSNPMLAKAIRGQLSYPASFNVSKLKSDYIARMRLQLYYQYRFIIDNEAELFKATYTQIDEKNIRAKAAVEAVKAAVDVATLIGGKDLNQIGLALTQVSALTVQGQNSVGTALTGTENLSGSTVDAIKGIGGLLFFAADPKRSASTLVGGASDLLKAGLDDEVQKELTSVISTGVQCAIARTDVAGCVAGLVEINTKAFWNYYSAFRLWQSQPKGNALNAADDFLSNYFAAGGDDNFISQKTGLKYPSDANARADFYNKAYAHVGGIDKEYFTQFIQQFMSTVNASTMLIREKIER